MVDLTEGAQGPIAASLLADLGAFVLKIERPGGEMMRRNMGKPLKRGEPLPVLSICHGRVASLALDLKERQSRDALLRLVTKADVVLEAWRPGTAEQLGLSYVDLKKVNPNLVYLSASGYGSSGPYARLGSFGSIAAASSGLSSVSGPVGDRTERPRIPLLDLLSALVTAEMAITAILSHVVQESTVQAETSQLEAALAAVGPVLAAFAAGHDRFGGGPCGSSDRWIAPSAMFPCRHGRFVAIQAETEEQWHALSDVLGIGISPEWETALGRASDADRLEACVSSKTATREADRLVTRLTELSVPAAIVRRSIGEAMQDRTISDQHVVSRHASESVGWIAMAQVPWRFEGCDVRTLWPCPRLGEAFQADWRELWFGPP